MLEFYTPNVQAESVANKTYIMEVGCKQTVTYKSDYSYSVKNNNIIKVTKKGSKFNITALKLGKTTVTIKDYKKKDIAIITVDVRKEREVITSSYVDLTIGKYILISELQEIKLVDVGDGYFEPAGIGDPRKVYIYTGDTITVDNETYVDIKVSKGKLYLKAKRGEIATLTVKNQKDNTVYTFEVGADDSEYFKEVVCNVGDTLKYDCDSFIIIRGDALKVEKTTSGVTIKAISSRGDSGLVDLLDKDGVLIKRLLIEVNESY